MNVLSLFDGISCARVALERAGFYVENYYASEIDPFAIDVSSKNWPDTHHIGSVDQVTKKNFPHIFKKGYIDLLIGGSPCQDLSIAKKERRGLDGDRSGLFWEYVRILKELKPKYFVLENVNSMPQSAKDIISIELGVEPIMIDAALVSAQNRKRLFWTNIPNITLPSDRGIYLKDILEDGAIPEREKSNTIRTGGRGSGHGDKHNWDEIKILQYRRTYWRENKSGKVPTLTANMGTGGNNVPYIQQVPRGRNPGGPRALDGKVPVLTSSSYEHNNHLVLKDGKRKITPIECERLQCLPDNYTMGISNSQRYKTLGNAFNVDVISHIVSFGNFGGITLSGRNVRKVLTECKKFQ